MAQQERAALKTLANNNVTTNNNKENTGLRVNQLIQEMIDSHLNLLSDAYRLLAEYDPAVNYLAGSFCEESGSIYKSNKATTGTFEPADWDLVVGGSDANYVELTHAQLLVLVGGSMLVPGTLYVITDFETKYQIVNTSTIDTSSTFSLVTRAISDSQLQADAWVPSWPQDLVKYDVNDILCEDGVTPRKGRITWRFDTTKNITAWYDWRNVKFRRWVSDGYLHDAVTKDSSSLCSVTATTGTNNVNNPGTVYEEYLLDFSAFTTHDASPELSVTVGGDTLQKEIKKYSGGTYSALAANEINTFLGADKLAVTMYIPGEDAYIIIDDQNRNDLFKAKNIGLDGSDMSIGNNYTIKMQTPLSFVDQLTFDNAVDPPIKDISIGKTDENDCMNNIVWHSNTGIDGTRIADNCWDISFGGKTEEAYIGPLSYNNVLLTDIGFAVVDGELYNMMVAGTRYAYARLRFLRNTTMFLNTTAVYNEILNGKDSTLRWIGGTAGQMTYNEFRDGFARCYIYWESADRNTLLTTTDTVWEPGANWTAVFYVTTKPGTRLSITEARTNSVIADKFFTLDPSTAVFNTDHGVAIDPNTGELKTTGQLALKHMTDTGIFVPPDETNDDTEGYSIGSLWIIAGAGWRAWICTDNTTGSAQWRYLNAERGYLIMRRGTSSSGSTTPISPTNQDLTDGRWHRLNDPGTDITFTLPATPEVEFANDNTTAGYEKGTLMLTAFHASNSNGTRIIIDPNGKEINGSTSNYTVAGTGTELSYIQIRWVSTGAFGSGDGFWQIMSELPASSGGGGGDEVEYLNVHTDRDAVVNSDDYWYWKGDIAMSSAFTAGLDVAGLIPWQGPFDGEIDEWVFTFNALATDAGSVDANIDLNLEVWEVGGSSEGVKLGDLVLNIPTAGITVGTFQDTSANQGATLSGTFSSPLAIDKDKIYAIKYKDGTGSGEVKAVKDGFFKFRAKKN